jgi:type II secretory pathway component HofQ
MSARHDAHYEKVLNATSVLIYPNTPAKLKEYQELLVKAFYLSNVDANTAKPSNNADWHFLSAYGL